MGLVIFLVEILRNHLWVFDRFFFLEKNLLLYAEETDDIFFCCKIEATKQVLVYHLCIVEST